MSGSMRFSKKIAAIIKRDGVACWLCGKDVNLNLRGQKHPLSPTLDHVVPRSKGGRHIINNLRIAHKECNERRGNTDPPSPG